MGNENIKLVDITIDGHGTSKGVLKSDMESIKTRCKETTDELNKRMLGEHQSMPLPLSQEYMGKIVEKYGRPIILGPSEKFDLYGDNEALSKIHVVNDGKYNTIVGEAGHPSENKVEKIELSSMYGEKKQPQEETKSNEIIFPKDDYDKYETRDLSWVKFNNRVLDLAKDDKTPLLERLKFLGISSSNLDEFLMIRMAYLMKLTQENSFDKSINGLLPAQEYKQLNKDVNDLISTQYTVLGNIKEELNKLGYKIIENKSHIEKKTKKWLHDYFDDKVLPLLTPIVFDNSRPFPLIQNKAINIGVLIEDSRFNYNMFGTIQVPNIDRLIEIKCKSVPQGERHFIFLEDLISMHLKKIFLNKKIISHCEYRILRNFDDVVDPKTGNVFLADKMRESIKRRESGDVVSLQYTHGKKEIVKIIQKALKVNKASMVKVDGIIDLSFGSKINVALTDEERNKLTYTPFRPQLGMDVFGEYDIFEAIDRNNIFLHHPYESYDTVVEFIKQASENPEVMSIKQTLYRLSDKSPIMQALIHAAESGKQVTVLLEVRARMNELDNIQWAAKLERAGGHVIYGVENLKTHCKMTLVTRRSRKGNLKQYVHIGTGNYNDVTAKLYTDFSMLSSNKGLCKDVNQLFNMLTGFSEPKLDKIIAAPHNLRNSLLSLIDREMQHVKNGSSGHIVIKVNSLTDKVIIDKLYDASKAGVKIELIVRGACSLVTDVAGISENISVISIVGRFLEHSRAYWFNNAGKTEMYIASADLMERNLDKRFEIMVPVANDVIKTRLSNILKSYLNDQSAYELHGKEYIKRDGNGTPVQDYFCSEAYKHNKVKNINKLYVRTK